MGLAESIAISLAHTGGRSGAPLPKPLQKPRKKFPGVGGPKDPEKSKITRCAQA